MVSQPASPPHGPLDHINHKNAQPSLTFSQSFFDFLTSWFCRPGNLLQRILMFNLESNTPHQNLTPTLQLFLS
ncbi:hypothetical protein CEXT_542491, partial [Caerostris extrusa]